MRCPDPWIHGRARSADAGCDPAQVLARAYESTREEIDVELEITEGVLPRELEGSYYRNGPGRLVVGGDRCGHPIDGDGMLVRVRIEGTRAFYRNRYVRTREWIDEERAGRRLYPGLATLRPGGWRANALRPPKNTASAGLLWHAGALYALHEGGCPHRIDPRSLATIGRDDLRGALRPRSALARALGLELPFGAGPAVDAGSGELWGVGAVLAPRPRLFVYRIDASGEPIERRAVPLARPVPVSELVLTRTSAIVPLPSVTFEAARVLAGLASTAGAMRQDPALAAAVLLVPRDGGPTRTIPMRPFLAAAHLGAWEEGRTVVLETLRADGLEVVPHDPLDPGSVRRQVPVRAQPVRLRIDLAAGRVDELRTIDADLGQPTTDPRRQGRALRFAWALARPSGWRAASRPALAKVDLETGRVALLDFAPDLPGTPVFVPRPGGSAEDDGWILALLYRARAHRSDFVVLDARDLALVARAAIPHHVPPGLRGLFVGDLERSNPA